MRDGGYKNTKMQGAAGIGAAIAFATEHGFVVSIPLNDSQEYDLVFDKDDKLCKVQVKTTYSLSPYGIYEVDLRQKGGNKSGHTTKLFDASKIDYLFVVTSDNTRYFIPSQHITSTTGICLGDKFAEFIV